MKVPRIGEGTWNMERDSESEAVAAIQRALDLGIGHLDTAELYGSGEVEEIVGKALVGRRDEAFLVSKVLPSNASRRGTIQACERSLKRLRTDHLDCYLLHWPGEHALEDTLAAFEQLSAAGKIRSWGVSNFDLAELEEALAIAGEGKMTCNQVLYHLKERAIEFEVIPWCEKHKVTVVAYSPFGSGDFPAPRSKGGEALRAIAEKHGANDRQVALAYLTRRKSVVTIPKSSSPRRVEQNAAAGAIELTPEEIDQLDKVFPLGPKRGLPTL